MDEISKLYTLYKQELALAKQEGSSTSKGQEHQTRATELLKHINELQRPNTTASSASSPAPVTTSTSKSPPAPSTPTTSNTSSNTPVGSTNTGSNALSNDYKNALSNLRLKFTQGQQKLAEIDAAVENGNLKQEEATRLRRQEQLIMDQTASRISVFQQRMSTATQSTHSNSNSNQSLQNSKVNTPGNQVNQGGSSQLNMKRPIIRPTPSYNQPHMGTSTMQINRSSPVTSRSLMSNPHTPITHNMSMMNRPNNSVTRPLPLSTPQHSSMLQPPGRVLSKLKLQELIRRLNPQPVQPSNSSSSFIDDDIDPDLLELFQDLTESFITDVINFSARIAKHRGSDTIDTRDVQVNLERNWGIRVPNGIGEDIRSVKRIKGNETKDSKDKK